MAMQDATEMRDTPTSQVAVAGQKAVAQVEGVQPSEEEEVTSAWKSWIFLLRLLRHVFYFKVLNVHI